MPVILPMVNDRPCGKRIICFAIKEIKTQAFGTS